ncbi:YesN/AraC family two-component response regulator [Paenibacillus aceris]|uniref:YesN/AraC family two-component response regulator n=2 Tax=Paenibacillus aceris TaxID=869555 RepID=A0ABS4I0S5_9BACL|nr:response regulator [Paenibacillus aceris]MBP1964518.1 YesN/AraC family two-component response regulator [Paenibacillus aceris]
MYSLLIVDDERWVRQGLVSTIDWQAEGIEVLGDVEDGEEALKFIQSHIPDIIITDIKMPRMDGLTFIETLKNANLSSKIIIISGYSEFSYAQKAMRFGAVDYVLKPIEETLMLDVVRKCIEQIKREREDHHEFVQMSESIRESLPLARQRYLETLLTNESASNQYSRTVWDRLNIPLDPHHLKVIIVKVYDWGLHEQNPKEHYLLRHAIGNFAKETVKMIGKMITCPLHDHEDADLALLISPLNEADHWSEQGTWETLITACWRHLGIGINIGMSHKSEITKLHASFQDAIQASAYAFYDGYGKVYAAEGKEKPPSWPLQTYSQPNGWMTRFIHAVKLGDDGALQALIDELFTHLQLHREKCSPLLLRKGLTSLFSEIEKKLWTSYSSEPNANLKSFILPYFALPELKDVLRAIVLKFQIGDSTSGNRKRFIELAVKYMEEHYTEQLTMNRVAEHLFLNPSYFSKLFHEKMGETFSKYIIRLRVNKAKELLKDSTLKIYEVAEQVGYQDFRHFVKLFKEQEGMTPAQYRDRGV